jgi:arabinogalactan endo-1,4-beta-galactosidase
MKIKIISVFILFSFCIEDRAQKLLGGDVSLLPSYEGAGTVYKDFDGKDVKLLPFLNSKVGTVSVSGCSSIPITLLATIRMRAFVRILIM